jgi:predicted component of type VI protein secretion system
MKTQIILIPFIALSLVACSSNPHKAEKIETELEKRAEVSMDTTLGIKEGNLVVQKKVMMNEEVRRLQNDVYALQDNVYGNRIYGSLGTYGVLRKCKLDVADKSIGGDGKLSWTEAMERVADAEDEYKIGIDEQEKLVGISEEFLKDRINRFKQYRSILEKRQDEYEEKLAICQAELKSRRFEASQMALMQDKEMQ